MNSELIQLKYEIFNNQQNKSLLNLLNYFNKFKLILSYKKKKYKFKLKKWLLHKFTYNYMYKIFF
jgi:hypothetical protein